MVFGTNLWGIVYGSLPYSPSRLNNVKITFTPAGGGTGTDAYMVYTYGAGAANQLAAILPSNLPAGGYNVTVTNAGVASAAFKANVVAQNPTTERRAPLTCAGAYPFKC